MNYADDITYVSDVIDYTIILCVSKNFDIDIISNMGFSFQLDKNAWILPCKSDEEVAEYFRKLRGIGVAFSAGHDWSPSELFQLFRKNTWISGKFIEFFSRGPGKYETRVL